MSRLVFNSHRSSIFGLHNAVATTQPLASEIGMQVLRKGGNAVDAAIAIAAALNVTEPCSTGIGGDCFCLYYDAKTKLVHGLNGSGRSPKLLTLQKVRQDGIVGPSLPPVHIHTVTVPGTAAGWCDAIEKFGSMPLSEVLAPAIQLAEEGFPVQRLTSHYWGVDARLKLMDTIANPHAKCFLNADGHPPLPGEVMTNLALAQTFRELGKHGKKGFYEGRIAQAIADAVQSRGGVLSLDDLKNHTSTFDAPISVNYKGIDVFEIPPNGQGLTALLALNVLEEMDMGSLGHNSVQYLHNLVEALRVAFADTKWYVTDPKFSNVPMKELLSKDYASVRRKLIDLEKANPLLEHGSPAHSCDTVQFCVVDGEGNACSFIQSNYAGFGTGVVPEGCGFSLQSRGANFSLVEGHPNVLEGGKRTYHTIIPGMALKDGELYCCFGVMGGYMQPQGHVQVLLNMLEFGMNPQEALDAPRVCILPDEHEDFAHASVLVEEGVSEETLAALAARGHRTCPTLTTGLARAVFGRGQIIKQHLGNTKGKSKGRVWEAGSDPRADGLAIAW